MTSACALSQERIELLQVDLEHSKRQKVNAESEIVDLERKKIEREMKFMDLENKHLEKLHQAKNEMVSLWSSDRHEALLCGH